MFGNPAPAAKTSDDIPIEQLAQQIKKLNAPVQRKTLQLCTEIKRLNSYLENKIKQCDTLCDSGEVRQMDELYDRGIEIVSEFLEKQERVLESLRGQAGSGSRARDWQLMSEKLVQIDYEVKVMSERMPMLDRVIKIQREIRKVEKGLNELEDGLNSRQQK